jgi:hypothetical protein
MGALTISGEQYSRGEDPVGGDVVNRRKRVYEIKVVWVLRVPVVWCPCSACESASAYALCVSGVELPIVNSENWVGALVLVGRGL